VRGLNKWFAITDPIIRSCNGIVDKRMGDGILIVFLDEHNDRDGRHPVQRAAAAAVGMLNALEESRGRLSSEAPGFASMQIRHAIHFGKAIVGNMGSEERMEYTVIGDAVNTCARLEEVTPAGVTWMSGEAVDAVSAHGLSGLRLEQTTTLRGRTSPTTIWSLDPEGEATASGTWLSAGSTASITTSLVAQEAVERQDEADL
jgi:adenylate cyclase